MITCATFVKAINIAFLGIVYFASGASISYIYSKYIFSEYDYEKGNIENIVWLFLDIGLLMIIVYIVRSIIIHFERDSKYNFFNGICGFNSKKIMEVNGGIMLTFSFLMYLSEPLKLKTKIIRENIFTRVKLDLDALPSSH